MCKICQKIICPPMCPNAEEEQPVCRCSECRQNIYEGEAVMVFGDKVFCENCTDAHRTTAERGKQFDEQSVVQENKRREAAWRMMFGGYEASR